MGLPAYEVSNHARPGGESRHNLVYWRYGEYAGVGPGAHGRLVTPSGRLAQACERHPETWLTQVETEGHGLIENTPLAPEEQGDEYLLMGLRLAEGIDSGRYRALSGRELNRERLARLIEDGFLERDLAGRLRVTSVGAPLLNSVVADLATPAIHKIPREFRLAKLKAGEAPPVSDNAHRHRPPLKVRSVPIQLTQTPTIHRLTGAERRHRISRPWLGSRP